jgi:hypothetical protein
MNGGQITSVSGNNLVLNSGTSDIVFNKGIKLPTTGGTQANLNYYQEDNVTIFFSGAVIPIGADVRFKRLNNWVTIDICSFVSPFDSGTEPIQTTVPIPSAYIPAVERDYPLQVRENTTLVLGCITISNTGIISIYSNIDPASGTFTTAGEHGLPHGGTVSYNIDTI